MTEEQRAPRRGLDPERLRLLVPPFLALLLVASGIWLSWDSSSRRAAERAGAEAVQAARDSIVVMLSYQPDTADNELDAARGRLTGPFLDAYTQLVKTVVVPDAKQKRITASARVPAAAAVSSERDRAVVLAYVDQTTTVARAAPTKASSSVRVSMEKVDGRWLISGFDPI